MQYWKKVNQDGNTTTVEAHSYPHTVPDAVEITKAEYDAFITSLPPPEPPEPTPDEARLAEIVATSPEAITMPDIWEAIRIIARLLLPGED